MSEYISRVAVLEHLNKCKEDPLFDPDMARICFAISIFIENMAAADVQPVKHGRWFHLTDESIVYCSECNSEAYWDTDYGQQLFDYCPYCGAKMTKDGDAK